MRIAPETSDAQISR